MTLKPRNSARIIENDVQSDATPAGRQRVRIPYQTNSVLFGGWGVKL